MDNQVIQPYELSVWEDVAPSGDINASYLEEQKIAIIAANGWETPIKAYNISLKEEITGKKTLTFNILRRYMERGGELRDNPFVTILTNERKIKLRIGEPYNLYDEDHHYSKAIAEQEDTENKWFDFIIKTVDEQRKSEVNTYTCEELFTTELGKNGYGVILDSELKNNYGTLNELAERVLQNSGWTVGSTYVPKEYHPEQLFIMSDPSQIEGKITIISMTSETRRKIDPDAIYTFSSELEVVDGTWRLSKEKPQFYYRGDTFTINDADDDRIIIDENDAYNYKSITPISNTIVWVPVSTALKGRKIIESAAIHYEPVEDRYVTDYSVLDANSGSTPGNIVYGYTETEYLTSTSLTNPILNSNNFSSTIGWMTFNGDLLELDPHRIISYPASDGSKDLSDYAKNYLAIKPDKKKTIYIINTGLQHNSFKIKRGEKYVLRVKARRINIDSAMTGQKTEEIDTTLAKEWATHGGPGLSIGISNWIDSSKAPEFIEGMSRQLRILTIDDSADMASYLQSRGYPQALANKKERQCYDEAEGYEWHRDEQGYLYCIWTAPMSYGNATTDNLALVIKQPAWTEDKYSWCIEDIQFHEYKEQTYEEVKIPLFIKDIPTIAIDTEYNFYEVRDGVAHTLASDLSYYKLLNREDYASIRHLDISKSNYFNIINELAELFEVWVGFRVAHQKDGKLLRDNDGYIKQVFFSRYSPFDEQNWAGFKYGINVDDIKRNTVSDAIATKTIVINNTNEFATDGMCSITRAIDNPSKENTIYNFDYYINQGLLSEDQVHHDFWGPTGIAYYQNMNYLNSQLETITKEVVALDGEIASNEQMYEEWKAAAEALEEEIASLKTQIKDYKDSGLTKTERYKNMITQLSIYNTQLKQIKGKENTDGSLNHYRQAADIAKNKLYGDYGNEPSYQGFWSAAVGYNIGQVVRVKYGEKDRFFKANIPSLDKDPMDPDNTNTGTRAVDEPIKYWTRISREKIEKNGLENVYLLLMDDKRRIEGKLFEKYNRYIQEGTWESNDYIDDNLYYLDGKKISDQSAYPKVTYTINVVELDGIKKYAGYTFRVGQRTYLEDPEFFGWTFKDKKGNVDEGTWKTPYRREVVVSERTRNFDDPSKSTITIQTYRNQWKDLFSKLTAATQSLTFASGGYQKAANLVDETGKLKVQKIAEAIKNNNLLFETLTNTVQIDNAGITVKNSTKPTQAIRITGSGVGITTDGGTTYHSAITPEGINTALLLAKQIDADKINITSSSNNYAFTWDEAGLNAFLRNASDKNKGTNGNVYVRYNNLGLFGTNKGEKIQDALAQNAGKNELELIDAIKDYTTFFLTWDGLYLNSDEGRIRLDPTKGFKIYAPLKWPQETLNSYAYKYDADGTPYTSNDYIPVVNLGRIENDSVITSQTYGLQLRNNSGYITLQTDNNGNLLLRNQLQVGFHNANEIISKQVTELIYIKKETKVVANTGESGEHIEYDYTVFLNHAPTEDTEIIVKRNLNGAEIFRFNSTEDAGGWIRSDENPANYILNIRADASLGYPSGYYYVTYFYDDSYSPFVGINGDGMTKTGYPIPLVIYAGYNAHSTRSTDYNTSPFRVYADGTLVAEDAQITGQINATSGTFSGAIRVGDTAGIDGRADADYVFYVSGKDDNNTTNTFYVTPQGQMYGSSVHVTSGTFEGNITAVNGQLNRLYLGEERSTGTVSYFGVGDQTIESGEEDTRIFINIRGLNFAVDGMGNIFGNKLFLGKNDTWASEITSTNNSIDLGTAYSIVINNQLNDDVITIYDPETTYDKKKEVFRVTKNGTVELAGTLYANQLGLKGSLIVGDEQEYVLIDGNGSISGKGADGNWFINGSGDASFRNVDVSGTLKTTVFEMEKVSAVGGTLAITPSIYVVKDTQKTIFGTSHLQGYAVDGLDNAVWKDGDQALITIIVEDEEDITNIHKTKYCLGIIKVDDGVKYLVLKSLKDDENIITQIQDLFGITIYSPPSDESIGIDNRMDNVDLDYLPANTSIININQNHNSIILRAADPLGSNIYMTSDSGDGLTESTLIGYLDPNKIKQVILDNGKPTDNPFLDTLKGTPQYGLYASNAFIEGKVYLPGAGITNEDVTLASDSYKDIILEGDPGYIRFWAGETPNNRQNAPFIVTSNGYLFATRGVFSGKINATDSEFSGVLKATGVALGDSDPNDTKDEYKHFYFSWTGQRIKTFANKDANINNYLLDIDENGINIWNNLKIYSRYYSNYYYDNKNDTWKENINRIHSFSNYNYNNKKEETFPIFNIIDKVDDGAAVTIPRINASRMQLWVASDSMLGTNATLPLYGMNFDGDRIRFVGENFSNKTINYESVANTLWGSGNEYFSIGHDTIGSKDFVGIKANSFDIYNSEGNVAIRVEKNQGTKNKISLGNATEDLIMLGNKIQIKIEDDGISFSYVS